MTTSLIVLTLLMAGIAGWLIFQSINVRPWVADSAHVVPLRQVPRTVTAPRVGLAVFLAVVTSVFALTISAYVMRMAASAEWQFLPQPGLAWVNTGFLVLASLVLQSASNAAKRQRQEALRLGLGVAAVCTVAFMVGQYLVWQQMSDAGYYLTRYPGSAFFALMTTLHGLHLLGGLVVLAKVVLRVRRGAAPSQVHEAVALCALYWHYLLFIWIVLFGVLFVGAVPLYELCRG